MFDEDDLLPISALQHLEYCARRCALVHIEGVWIENAQTAEGRALHERVHEAPSETVGGVRVARRLRLCSRELGLFGIADVVEFHPTESRDERTVALPGSPQRWIAFPVEYKRGPLKGKKGTVPGTKQGGQSPFSAVPADERGQSPFSGDEGGQSPSSGPEIPYRVQLCAQALCLEEMLGGLVPAGALYHGKSRRRQVVELDPYLRTRTWNRAQELHRLIRSGQTPPPVHGPKCKYCSLAGKCMPKLPPARSARDYVARSIEAVLEKEF